MEVVSTTPDHCSATSDIGYAALEFGEAGVDVLK